MTTNLALREPTLPGLLPDAEALALADSFKTELDGHRIILDRMPTAVERQMMVRRSSEIGAALKPLSIAQIPAAAEAIAGLLVGYGYARGDRAAEQTVTVYVKHLEQVPLFAIRAACEDVKAGRVFDVDQRTGNRKPLNPDKEPSTIRLRQIAQKHVDALEAERWRFDKVLMAKRALPPPADPAMRKRIEKLFFGLRERLAANMAGEDLAAAEDAVRKTEAKIESRRLEVAAEYERLGVEPVSIAGTVVSPELARKYGLASRRLEDDEPRSD
jgi:hypothetical protein